MNEDMIVEMNYWTYRDADGNLRARRDIPKGTTFYIPLYHESNAKVNTDLPKGEFVNL